jgi:hypothetical protein
MVGRLAVGAQASAPEKRMKTTWKRWMGGARRLTLPRLAMASAVLLALALGLSACQNVAGYTQPSLVRVIDASYIAPAVNFWVEGVLLGANLGEGTITNYGTVPASNSARVMVTATTVTNPTAANSLVTSTVTLAAGKQHSIFLTDNGAAPTSYTVTVLEDDISAAVGHSAFRLLNQAPKVGAVDVYMVPAGTTLDNTIPVATALPVGATADVTFTSQAVTMVITPTGVVTPKYTSKALGLTGGEVYTVVIIDSQLTSNPPVSVVLVCDNTDNTKCSL